VKVLIYRTRDSIINFVFDMASVSVLFLVGTGQLDCNHQSAIECRSVSSITQALLDDCSFVLHKKKL
jgi:hypothetical protein